MLYTRVIKEYSEVWIQLILRRHRCEGCNRRVDCLVTTKCKRPICVVQHPIGWNHFRNFHGEETYAVYYLDDSIITDLITQYGDPIGKKRHLSSIHYGSYILGYPFEV
jgi:hypothetical protein